MPKNRVGPPVRGDDLFGRDSFVDLLWRKLESSSVLLAAPRRFGKTSVMYRLIDQPRHGFKIVHADLEHLSDPADLVLELLVKLAADSKLSQVLEGIVAMPREIWAGMRSAVEEVEVLKLKLKLREQIAPQWQDTGRQLLHRIGVTKQPILFILDEFPMMIDRMAGLAERRSEAISLLRWLRAVRMSPELGNIRFLVAGSVGIEAVLGRLGEISAINDLERLTLNAFPDLVADDFLLCLADSEQLPLSVESRKKILDLIGIQVPYFLQIMFSEISKAHALTHIEISPSAIEDIYRTNVLGMDCKTYFEHYYGRLRDYYRPDEERAVKRVLRYLATSGALSADACYAVYAEVVGREANPEAFIATLSALQSDFYIRYDSSAGQYTFACKILRDWWLRHYALEAI